MRSKTYAITYVGVTTSLPCSGHVTPSQQDPDIAIEEAKRLREKHPEFSFSVMEYGRDGSSMYTRLIWRDGETI